MVVHEALQEVLAGIDQIEAADRSRREAFEQAVGMYLDDVVEPSVGVAVWHGRVIEVQIADRLCKREPGEIQDVLNGVMINAFAAWHSDYVRLLNDDGGRSSA